MPVDKNMVRDRSSGKSISDCSHKISFAIKKTWRDYHVLVVLLFSHSADLLVDVSITVNHIISSITGINPTKYRIIDLSGMGTL